MVISDLSHARQFGSSAAAFGWSAWELQDRLQKAGCDGRYIRRAMRAYNEQVARG